MALKTNIWKPDTCNCIVEYEFDDSLSIDQVTHTIKNSISKCSIHTDEPTLQDHWNALRNENPKKNRAWRLLLNNAPPEMIKTNDEGEIEFKRNIIITWMWSGTRPNRVLTINLKGYTLTQAQINFVNNKIDQEYPNQNIIFTNNNT